MTGINHVEDKKFGKIVDDFRCCTPSLLVYDEEKRLKYNIAGECCQCGLVCQSCDMCYDVKFSIFNGNCPSEDPKDAVGSIIRKKKSLTKSLFTDSDNFDIYFPDNATPYDKLMLIGATLMLDYTYFEDDGNEKTNINNY